MKVLMCVPNISEGRDLSIVGQVVDAIRHAPDVRLLDYSSDSHHNRSVLTYLGEPGAVLEATAAMTAKALELIDMSKHRGAHPRLGAVDVVPFLPIRGMTTAEAVEIARRFGQVAGQLGVPVYYYEEAAARPERRNLADIRKGEYEGLPAKLADEAWRPDEGPATFNARSGALVTGVRFPLVAFNVNLRTKDLEIGQTIARAVRHISGGFRYARAIALALEEEGMVQVSMNLTHYEKTPLHRVLETIRSEAARHGIAIAGTEIVGPVPLAALEEVVRFYLQAHGFSLAQVVEMALLE